MEDISLKVITSDGLEALFYKAEGMMAVLFSEGGGKYIQGKLISVNQLKEGKPLQFSYYDEASSAEKFVARTFIASIEEIEFD